MKNNTEGKSKENEPPKPKKSYENRSEMETEDPKRSQNVFKIGLKPTKMR